MKDRYTAIWVSHSSISDYLKCPRLYYLRNVYRDPKTHHKMAIMQPALALGQIVHDTIEALSRLPAAERFNTSLLDIFHTKWKSVHGEAGGFLNNEEEQKYLSKGDQMIQKVMDLPGPLMNRAIKIRQDLPNYYVSEDENIILCGKIDWLEYIEASDSVHIIDFKTGKYDEDPDSLQLPIYYLLVTHCQSRLVSKASYWYLERDNEPKEVSLPDEKTSEERVLEIAKKIALARKLEHLKCKQGDGCRFCKPYEQVVQGQATLVGVNDFGQDIYVLPRIASQEELVSEVSDFPVDEPF